MLIARISGFVRDSTFGVGAMAAGKPILTFGDMLRDLSERRTTTTTLVTTEPEEPESPTTRKQKKIAELRALFYTSNPLPQSKQRGTDPAQVEGLNLVNAYEKVYAELTAALSGDGNEWVSLSEQLRTLLITANQLISTAHKETGPLVDQIRVLQALVERGRSALANAQTSMHAQA